MNLFNSIIPYSGWILLVVAVWLIPLVINLNIDSGYDAVEEYEYWEEDPEVEELEEAEAAEAVAY